MDSDAAVFAPGLLAGRTALVTGGGSGIGLAIAEELGRLGARVILAARTFERLTEAAEHLQTLGVAAEAQTVNIRREEEVAALFDWAGERHGTVDILVNNAGGQFAAAPLDISPNGFRAVVDLNLNGTWHMSKAFVQQFIRTADGRGGERDGRIVNIVLSLFSGLPHMAHAAAARAGVVNLTKSLAVAWSRHGIRINAVAPGIIDTPALAQYDADRLERELQRLPNKRMGSAREIALAVAYLVSPAAGYVTGTTLIVDGGKHLMGAPGEA